MILSEYEQNLADKVCLTSQEYEILAKLTDKRRKHTLGVLAYGLELCERFGADDAMTAKYRLCALFHDLYRGLPEEATDEMVRKEGLPERYIGASALSHSKLAAIAMERDYGITDKEMLDAVSFHTTGRSGMTLLDKILYVADGAEPGREYPDVPELRKIAENDLDGAVRFSLEHTIAFCKMRNVPVDSDSLAALQYLEKANGQ